MCHCQHHHCCCPRYWCVSCGRYTHDKHYHGTWAWPVTTWCPPTPRPPVVVIHQSTHQRDRRTINALGGTRV